jgi:type IV secretion system protein VirD4
MTATQQLVLTVLAGGAGVGVLAIGHPDGGPRRSRRRLGVDTSARLARRSEIGPLVVWRGRHAGRFVLGYVKHRLVATEHHRNVRRRSVRRRGSVGDRSSVAIIGPTRCGKTAAAIGGILDWDGPAILSSVKSDVMAATIGWRRRLGEVRVFDPTASTSEASAGWSPLRGASSIAGAQQAARALIDAGPRGGAENLDFFLRLAEQLLWPHLYLAATNGATMRDVVRWIHAQTSPDDPTTDLARYAATVNGPAGVDAAEALAATWTLDRRTRASAYATGQTLLGAWTDPSVAAASEYDELDLAWLLEGNNTLYVCAPLHHQQRLAPVFGGLLGDLVNQAYERVNRTNTPLPSTLVVLDEAANTPTRWLPHVASTCAGIGLLLVTIWQSKAQLDAAYGPLADSVLTNHATKLIFAGVSDLPTLEYVSRLVGDEEIIRTSATLDRRQRDGSLTVSTQQTAMLPAHVLRQSRPGHALLVHGTLPPADLTSRPYFRDRRLSARAAITNAR